MRIFYILLLQLLVVVLAWTNKSVASWWIDIVIFLVLAIMVLPGVWSTVKFVKVKYMEKTIAQQLMLSKMPCFWHLLIAWIYVIALWSLVYIVRVC